MRYLGGKARIGKQIAEVVNRERKGPFWEPFAGGLNVSPHLARGGPGLISEKHPGLAALYSYAVANDLPTKVTKEQWELCKQAPDNHPLKAFVGFGCSYSGIWFGSYAPGGECFYPCNGKTQIRNYAEEAAKTFSKDARTCARLGCQFACLDFFDITPKPCDFTLYLDPPYRNTTGYLFDFDHDTFDRLVLEWSKFVPVFVSEYELPYGKIVWTKEKQVGLGHNRHAIEKLFRLGPS